MAPALPEAADHGSAGAPRRRVAIYGVTGSGKTTLGRRLAEALALPVVELDALMWTQPDWMMTPEDEFTRRVEVALDLHRDGWVVEGNYRAVRGLVLARADTVVWLRLPWRTSFWRLLKRTVRRARRRELLWGTNRESWRMTFFSRDSILWWSISHHRASQRSVAQTLREQPHSAQVFVVRSAREADALLARLAQGHARSAAPLSR